MKHALVTGGAGFIGRHLVDALLKDGWRVTVLDRRPCGLQKEFEGQIEADIRDDKWTELVRGVDVVVHLAALAGVRPSIQRPAAYVAVNVCGTQDVLDFARMFGVKQFVFASSSSVYGTNPRTPWAEDDRDLRPASPYAATKIAGEALCQTYAHLYGMRCVALRFFTVYGPHQRPDLAIRTFATKMLNGQPITIYGDGRSARDYTYIDDIVQGIKAAMVYDAKPYDVFNLGNTQPIALRDMVRRLEHALGVKAKIDRQPDQPGDVPITWANIGKAKALLGYNPQVSFDEGIWRFGEWMRSQDSLDKMAPSHRMETA